MSIWGWNQPNVHIIEEETRPGVNSILELKGNFKIGIAYLKKMELKFATKIFNPQINLPVLF